MIGNRKLTKIVAVVVAVVLVFGIVAGTIIPYL